MNAQASFQAVGCTVRIGVMKDPKPEPLDYAKPRTKGFPWSRVAIWIAAVVAVFWLARILAVAYVRTMFN